VTRAELIALMREAWTGDASSGLSNPLSAAQVAMIDAQLGAVADGIIAALASGVPGSTPRWHTEELLGTGTVFELDYAPINGSLLVFLNGLPQLGNWTLVGRTLTLDTARTSGDATLHAHYQAVIPT
jgi:hypothetical protein